LKLLKGPLYTWKWRQLMGDDKLHAEAEALEEEAQLQAEEEAPAGEVEEAQVEEEAPAGEVGV
jgi:hypothetical protein